MKECCEGVVEKCCGEVLSRSVVGKVVEKCCEGVLWRSGVKECCEGVL